MWALRLVVPAGDELRLRHQMRASALSGELGIAAALADGVAMAEDALASGLAAEKLKQFIDFTQFTIRCFKIFFDSSHTFQNVKPASSCLDSQ